MSVVPLIPARDIALTGTWAQIIAPLRVNGRTLLVEVLNRGPGTASIDVQASMDQTNFASCGILELLDIAPSTTRFAKLSGYATDIADYFNVLGRMDSGNGSIRLTIHRRDP